MLSRSALRVSRRCISTFPALRTEGAAASTGTFGVKEKAVENQWARVHDADLLQKLRKALQENEQATADIKQKLNDLEANIKKQ
ncbi:hypothetical protein K501DRAFT_200477 [Backusella circina FSU 941]|nr:hypothetical protein K501DRAFT_200477 [Backusella circina FSU 941]